MSSKKRVSGDYTIIADNTTVSGNLLVTGNVTVNGNSNVAGAATETTLAAINTKIPAQAIAGLLPVDTLGTPGASRVQGP